MTVTEKLKSLLTEQYVTEDGDEYKIELLAGLTDEEINNVAKVVPNGQIPNDIRELLKFASGFEFSGLEEITFNGVGQFGFEEIFPNSVQLAGDGFGNFWILDIDKNGHWGFVRLELLLLNCQSLGRSNLATIQLYIRLRLLKHIVLSE